MFRRAILALALLSVTFSLPAFAQGCDTKIDVVNQSPHTIMEIYYSSSAENAWGVDRLGANVLEQGQSVSFRPTSPGNHDFKVVFGSGRSVELRQVDVCSVSILHVQDQGIRPQ